MRPEQTPGRSPEIETAKHVYEITELFYHDAAIDLATASCDPETLADEIDVLKERFTARREAFLNAAEALVNIIAPKPADGTTASREVPTD